jgi:hypothetical protein
VFIIDYFKCSTSWLRNFLRFHVSKKYAYMEGIYQIWRSVLMYSEPTHMDFFHRGFKHTLRHDLGVKTQKKCTHRIRVKIQNVAWQNFFKKVLVHDITALIDYSFVTKYTGRLKMLFIMKNTEKFDFRRKSRKLMIILASRPIILRLPAMTNYHHELIIIAV